MLMELTMSDGGVSTEDRVPPLSSNRTENYENRTYEDYLDSVDMITSSGYHAAVTSHFEYWRLSQFIRKWTKESIVIALGTPSLSELFDEKYYENLGGGLLEGFGRLLRFNTNLYVYPSMTDAGEIQGSADLVLDDPTVQLLKEFLVQRSTLLEIEQFDADIVRQFRGLRSRDITE